MKNKTKTVFLLSWYKNHDCTCIFGNPRCEAYTFTKNYAQTFLAEYLNAYIQMKDLMYKYDMTRRRGLLPSLRKKEPPAED